MHLTVPIIGILRGVKKKFFQCIVAHSFDVGLQAIEVTMNTEGALDMVTSSRGSVKKGQLLGMGTICTLLDAQKAIEAGAMFLVTPMYSAEVIEYGKAHNIPVICGALTPTEIFNAWQAGASMIKVFPCQALGGAHYIKQLRGPFNDIPLMAVGGVSSNTIGEYFKAGANAIGVSTALFGTQALKEQNLELVIENIKEFTSLVNQEVKMI